MSASALPIAEETSESSDRPIPDLDEPDDKPF
jgi:hypothetical protein